MSDDIAANEFDCSGCGRHIISVPRREPAPTRCDLCMWLEEFVPDPAERAAILKQTNPE